MDLAASPRPWRLGITAEANVKLSTGRCMLASIHKEEYKARYRYAAHPEQVADNF
jgi:hypothetical protein